MFFSNLAANAHTRRGEKDKNTMEKTNARSVSELTIYTAINGYIEADCI